MNMTKYMNMKQISIVLLLLCGLVCTSCNRSSYSAQLKNEKALIADFIKRQGYEIIYEAPKYEDWVKPENQKKLLELDEYCYFRLTKLGDMEADSAVYKDNVLLRYRQYTLDVVADTLSFWNTNESAFPIELQYGVSTENSCTGWQLALAKMKYSGAEALVIVPSKMGFNDAAKSVTPYGFDLKMQVKPY